ncbi:MAG: hypothetical protein ACXVA9_12700 [Bdellovibrionales bacterium]
MKKHIGLTNVLCAIAFSVASTYAAFAEPDPRGLMIFCIFIIGAEIFVYMRWRMSIICSMCGFDPIVYKRSPSKASARVSEFFKDQVENPEFWLSKSPLLKHQKMIKAQEKKALETQIILNRAKSSSLAPTKTL